MMELLSPQVTPQNQPAALPRILEMDILLPKGHCALPLPFLVCRAALRTPEAHPFFASFTSTQGSGTAFSLSKPWCQMGALVGLCQLRESDNGRPSAPKTGIGNNLYAHLWKEDFLYLSAEMLETRCCLCQRPTLNEQPLFLTLGHVHIPKTLLQKF